MSVEGSDLEEEPVICAQVGCVADGHGVLWATISCTAGRACRRGGAVHSPKAKKVSLLPVQLGAQCETSVVHRVQGAQGIEI